MATRDQNINGGADLDRLLQTLPTKLERNIMRAALRAGAAEILPEVQNRIPTDSGQLRASARITTRYRKGEVSASVKVGNFVAWYAHLVEFGTRPHRIVPKNPGGVLRFGGLEVRSVDHPGIRPQPFMRPAADASLERAIARVTAKIRERLTNAGIDTPAPTPSDPEE
jgi:HK97 gp10 family phage protein